MSASPESPTIQRGLLARLSAALRSRCFNPSRSEDAQCICTYINILLIQCTKNDIKITLRHKSVRNPAMSTWTSEDKKSVLFI